MPCNQKTYSWNQKSVVEQTVKHDEISVTRRRLEEKTTIIAYRQGHISVFIIFICTYDNTNPLSQFCRSKVKHNVIYETVRGPRYVRMGNERRAHNNNMKKNTKNNSRKIMYSTDKNACALSASRRSRRV